MLNRIAHVLFFVCVLGHVTVGTSPTMAVVLAAVGIALMLLQPGIRASRKR